MSVPETKEVQAEWKADVVLPEYTLKDVAAHNTKGDTWMVIHGQGMHVDTSARPKLTLDSL
jgi:cytochrome-b5 reductase